MKEECGDAFRGDVFLCGTENHPLSKPMVDHDQKGIEAGGGREIGDKITGDLLEGAGCAGADGGERRNSGMGVGLVLLAGSTALNIFADVGGETGPPKFRCNELSGFQVAGVPGALVVMATLKNSVAEGIIGRDIDTALVGQDARVDLPVGEAGTEGEGDVVIHGLEGLEDEGVACRGRLNTVEEGHIDNVDEEGRGKESNSVIVIIRLGKEVRATREGVWAGEELSWDVDHLQVKIREVNEPTGLSTVEVLGRTEVGEVFVVGEDLDRKGRPMEVVSPRFQGADDGEEFSIVNVVVPLGWGE